MISVSRGQVKKMLEGTLKEVGKSLATTGYIKLDNGFIIQWGRKLRNTSANQSVSYPVSFPSGIAPALATTWQTSGNVSSYINTISNNANGFTILSGGWGADYYVGWIAIGY